MAASDEQPSRIYDDAPKFYAPDVLILKERVNAMDRRLLATEGSVARDMVDIEKRIDAVELSLVGGYGMSRLDEIELRIDALSKRTEKGDYGYLSWLLPVVAGAVALLWLLWEAQDDT